MDHPHPLWYGPAMRVIGLTGGIGCGKSTVAALVRARGIPVVDADDLARRIVEPGTPALAEISRTFGEETLTPDGRLDRKRLANIVFSDPTALRTLNAITHPRIIEAAAAALADLRAEGHPLVFFEAALLMEAGWESATTMVVVVTTAPDRQLARLVRRGDVEEADARARIASQMPLADKEARADHIIRNDGDLSALERRVDDLIFDLLEHEPSRRQHQ